MYSFRGYLDKWVTGIFKGRFESIAIFEFPAFGELAGRIICNTSAERHYHCDILHISISSPFYKIINSAGCLYNAV